MLFYFTLFFKIKRLKTFYLFSYVLIIFLLRIIFPQNIIAATNWIKYSGNPIVEPGAPGEWDEKYIYPGTVIKEGSEYKMWYTGSDRTGREQIGYATSTDGITWNKYDGDPVLKASSETGWDSYIAAQASVIFDGTNYLMWYSGNNGPVTKENWKIGFASSPDGIHWTKYSGNPVLEPSQTGWDNKAVYQPEVEKTDDNQFYMWYSATSKTVSSLRWKIGFATSIDGKNWTKYSGNPVIRPVQSWETSGGDGVNDPSVYYDGYIFHIWYHAHGIGYAQSLDGITWEKYTQNPVVPRGTPPNDWDYFFILSTNVFKDINNYKMWYAGETNYNSSKIGLATTDELPEIIPRKAPIVIVPGILSSINSIRGIPCDLSVNGDWIPVPILAKLYYKALLDTLTVDAKLEMNKDVYFYSYDWRQTPEVLADNFKNYIDTISQDHPSGTKFKMVGHSLGGLVLRSYVQKYANNKALKILTAGTPHKGTVVAYNVWEKGNLDTIEDQAMKLLLETILWKCQIRSIGIPFFNNFRELKPADLKLIKSRREVVQNSAPIINSLLPIFDYLKKNGNPIHYFDMNQKNTWLINHPLSNPVNLPLKETVSGKNRSTLRYINIIAPSKQERRAGEWIDGKPVSYEKNLEGDDTILVESSRIAGLDNLNIEGNHQDTIASKAAIKEILKFLDLPEIEVTRESAIPNLSDQIILSITADTNLQMTLTGNDKSSVESEENILIKVNPAGGNYNLKIKSNQSVNTTLYVMLAKKGEEVKNRIYQIKLQKDKPLEFRLIYSPGKSAFLQLLPV
ncbi:hypothetical protein A2W14_00155 [Candidatus Gottesmanbacteria bacterium RBG_16_37_8]|uniref:DUF676 domain-containing protein n=1 Tax=Candidatus Gottesmanbacteria bacterium RBG_16_37_8 TaxID=1798371 RepID=A0A1F5YRV4_9BACT|nr:MAG: hypothetical protein A2W14_00155 [Candidatus Gottesmanbacteria bacterium RBG_16_37_8]